MNDLLIDFQVNEAGTQFLFDLLGKLPIESLNEKELDFVQKLRASLTKSMAVFQEESGDETDDNTQT
jgi:hypothetical protein